MKYDGVALTIAGSDSGGGAGIQADLKTFAAFNVYGVSVITSVTAQNTVEVLSVFDLPSGVVASQIDAIATDINVDAVKIGMLSNVEIMKVVSEKLIAYDMRMVVVDPVMVSKSGSILMKKEAIGFFIEHILPLSYVLTPNIPEAEILSGMKITSPVDMKEAARMIANKGARYVLLKGGHLEGYSEVTDILYDGSNSYVFQSDRIDTKNTHGTGCTLSSAIASSLAKGKDVYASVSDAHRYVNMAIREAPDNIGHGFGPLYHNIRGVK